MDERRDDWRNGVDKKIVDLTSAQRTTDDLLEELDANYAAVDRLLRGDPEKETDGLIGRLHYLETRINEVYGILDPAGDLGLVHKVTALESEERTSGERWKFATAAFVAIISLIGLLITNWSHIEAWVTQDNGEHIQQNKHTHPRKIIIRKVQDLPEE